MSKKKEKDVDVKNNAMEGMPDTDKKSGKKPKELPGMPKKSALGKQADKVIEKWELLKDMQEQLQDEKNRLLPLMKEQSKLVLSLKDSNGNSLEVKITSSNEKISINKKKELNI